MSPTPSKQRRPVDRDHVDRQLADLVDLVATGPVELGAYTQAEMTVVLGGAPALAREDDAALAEAVRSLAARGVLHRMPGGREVELTGDLGLIVALSEHSLGTLEIRRGHAGAADGEWRWLISIFDEEIVGLDRIDSLGLHRLSLFAVNGIIEGVTAALIRGHAKVPHGPLTPEPIDDAAVRRLAESAEERWQLIHRVRSADGSGLVIDALVVRIDEKHVDLITRDPSGTGYQRVPADAERLRQFLTGLLDLHRGPGVAGSS